MSPRASGGGPGRWWCTKCARQVTGPVTTTLDPRYATGLCRHGRNDQEAEPETVPLVRSEAAADQLIERRRVARAYTRALHKQVAGEALSKNEEAALAARATAEVATP